MIEGLKAYAEYKESGLTWLDRIPEGWDEQRSKYLFREVDHRSMTGDETRLSMTQRHGLVPSADVEEKRLASKTNIGGKICESGDLVLNRLKAHLGVFALAGQRGAVSPDYTVFRAVGSINGPYFCTLYRSPYCGQELRRTAKGIVEGFWRLYTDQFYDIRVPVPPSDEQAAIVRFLDHANRKIDGFIRAKRKLIGLLNEQKQAIIHRAVTRGLNPDAPLKPSGIPWLGDIPAHWEACAFARLSRVVRGSSPRPAGDARFFNGNSVPWVTVGEVTKDKEMFLTSTSTFLTPMGAERSTMFPAGTLILTNSGATLGVPKILEIDACANDGVVAFLGLRPAIQKPFAYLYLSTLTTRLRDEMRQGGTQPNLNTGIVRRIVCPVPPIAEQEAILIYVGKESEPLKTVIARTEREIALMQEYRTRLTADIVTGKLDVREAAGRLPLEKDREAESETLPDDAESELDEQSANE